MSDESAEKIVIQGKELGCQICSHNLFWKREALLNTTVATFFNFEWANPSAVCVICENCKYIHWFYFLDED